MKSVNEVREMLKEAKEKYVKAYMEVENATNSHNRQSAMIKRQLAEAEVKCFNSVLGVDAIEVKS